MYMGMPTIVTATTFDLQKINSAFLRLCPQFPTSQFGEGLVDPVDVFADGIGSLAECQSDQSDGFAGRKFTHAGSDMSCTFGCTGLTESVSASVAGDLEHVWIIHGLHDPSTTPTIVETSAAILSLFDRLQGTLNTITTVSPSGVPESHTAIVRCIFRPSRRALRIVMRSCFEGIKSIGNSGVVVRHCGNLSKLQRRSAGLREYRTSRRNKERAVHKGLAT